MAGTKIIAVSDVHLGAEDSESEEFSRFIEEYVKKECPEHLVLCGDILELTTKDMADTILENEQILMQLQRLQEHGINVHYLVGNHDISLLDILQQYFPCDLEGYFPFDIRKDLRLQAGDKNYYFRHGYELEVWLSFHKDIEAYENLFRYMCISSPLRWIGSTIWGIVQALLAVLSPFSAKRRTQKDLRRAVSQTADRRIKPKVSRKIDKLACSDVLNMFVPIARDEVFVFGHTHRPFPDPPFPDTKVWNTGSWKRSKKHKFKSYITIDDTGKAALSYF